MSEKSLDLDAVRCLGAMLPDVKVNSGGRGVALKIDRRLLACEAIHKSAEPNSLMVRVSQVRREALLAQDPQTFYVTDHYVPYDAVLVRLSKIRRTALKALLVESSHFVRD